jgi:hypothetical protein
MSTEGERQPQSSALKTLGRELLGKAGGIGVWALGIVCFIAVFYVGLALSREHWLPVFAIGLPISIGICALGNYMCKKAQHIAWTREAIERQANASVRERLCPDCGVPSPDGAAFCRECGAALQTTCEGCGQVNSPGANFCMNCGGKLEAPRRTGDAANPEA